MEVSELCDPFYPSNKNKIQNYVVRPMGHKTETKTSNATLPQCEPTALAGKMMFLLWMLDGHGLQSFKMLC